MLYSHKVLRKLCLLLIICISFQHIFFAQATDYIKLSQLASMRYGERARLAVLSLQDTINKLKSASELQKITAINDFFNVKITRFDEDINIWGQVDYWATPLESLGKEAGDCEDFSIAKYVFLRELNIPNERLKLTYVRIKIGGPDSKISQAHMVLSYYPTVTSEPLILDNMIAEILPASRRPDLTPIFSFNSEGLWVTGSAAQQGDSPSHLSRWRDVLNRIKADGIE